MKAPGVRRGSAPAWLAGLAFAAAGASIAACYSTGGGSGPPLKSLYFPVGLAVPRNQKVLYVANSDFDLQWNGGTVQAFDLERVRRDAFANMATPGSAPGIRYAHGVATGCNGGPATYADGTRPPIAFTCAPPTFESDYWLNGVVIGAFATDLQLAPDGTRAYVPVRGSASLTWLDLDPSAAAPAVPPLGCDADGEMRCGATHQAGVDPNEPGNTRHVTMPGEPFGMGITADGESIVITHQNDAEVSLFSAKKVSGNAPSLQFVLTGVPPGGVGLALVPHDPDGLQPGQVMPNPAFLFTSHTNAEIDVLRVYPDQTSQIGAGATSNLSSSVLRPFLVRERAYPLGANAGGSDSRGILVDDTPRRACKAALAAGGGSAGDAARRACAQIPARVFFANRTPNSLVTGDVGALDTISDHPLYDFDRLVVTGNVPLTAGPSKLYLAPVVDAQGRYALRLFVICFDSATVFVWDPDAGRLENVIRVGAGPFAMAFDTFDMDAVARRDVAPRDADGRAAYHFAYVASFTNSFVQVVDLDNSDANNLDWYERVVFTLGQPTLPKGS